MACKLGFCWCCISLLQTAQKTRNRKVDIIQQINAVDGPRRYEKAIAGVARWNISVVNKSVTAEIKKVEIEVVGFFVSLLNSNC